MKKFFTSFLLLTCSLSYSFAQTYSGPESVEYDAANNRYLVACKGNTKSIQQVVPGNAPTLFTSNVSNPYGIEILGNKLWVCDNGSSIKSIKSFDLTTATLVDNITITGASFLNGITNDGDHFLFVSDYTAKKIYRVNTNTGAFYTMVANTVTSPNGMWYDGANNRVLFVNWGSNAPVKAISLADSSVTTAVTTTLTNCDGIGRDAAGNYFISSWTPQAVYKYNSSFGSPTSVVSSGLSNPADIYYNTANDTIAVPNSNNNTVTFHYVGTTVSIPEEAKQSVTIFPNPASKFLNVELNTATQNADMVIQNLTGEIIYLSKIKNQKSAIDISNFAAGEYIYSVQTESGEFNGRFTVVK